MPYPSPHEQKKDREDVAAFVLAAFVGLIVLLAMGTAMYEDHRDYVNQKNNPYSK